MNDSREVGVDGWCGAAGVDSWRGVNDSRVLDKDSWWGVNDSRVVGVDGWCGVDSSRAMGVDSRHGVRGCTRRCAKLYCGRTPLLLRRRRSRHSCCESAWLMWWQLPRPWSWPCFSRPAERR